MTLTTRLLVFFLAGLAAVLAGFSAALVLLAREYLHRQTADRLEAAANTLVAACEVGPDGVEWEPHERALAFGSGPAGDRVAWLVTDDRGRPVDRSADPGGDDLLAEAAARLAATRRETTRVEWRGERWQVRQQWLAAPPSVGPTAPRPPAEAGVRYPALAVTVGLPLEPGRTALWRLGGVLAGLSVVVWLAALAAGRAVCRRALRPLTRMADAARAMPADDRGGQLPVGPARDELADLGAAFNGLLARVGEAAERQRRFTAEASHQLRTPLAAVLGQVDVALRRDRDPAEYRRALEAVRREADRLRSVVDALLFLARSDADARLPDRERVDLAAWLPDHLRCWADHPRAGDLVTSSDPAVADVHPVLLGELVNVLVDNALRYSPGGTPVTVRVGAAGQAVELSVSDAGPGIEPADLERVFDPFYRSADARRRGVEGTGLGLVVARRIAAALGGELSAESRPSGGTRFTLRVAAATDAATLPKSRPKVPGEPETVRPGFLTGESRRNPPFDTIAKLTGGGKPKR